jgi:hypothetical protein
MSMIGNFLLVSDAEIASLLEAPCAVHEFLERRVYQAASPVEYLDVDEAWHALHFLLTGTAWEGAPPLNFIVSGGNSIGDEDVGYSPARALRAREVASLHRALEGLDAQELLRRYDGPAMDALGVYPGGWAACDPTKGNAFGYCSGAYEELRALVRRGAGLGRGLLVWLT